MKQNKTIRSLVALLLLFVFAISSSPKSYFHEAFADHIDAGQVCTDNVNSPHFHQSGINCHCDQLVTSSVYHFIAGSLPDLAISFTEEPNPGVETVSLLDVYVAKESRGPPSLSF